MKEANSIYTLSHSCGDNRIVFVTNNTMTYAHYCKTRAGNFLSRIMENTLSLCTTKQLVVSTRSTNANCLISHDEYQLLIAGLQGRCRHLFPHQYNINCRNHNLALCVKHLIKDFPILAEVDIALLAPWKLFDNSQQRFAVFKDVQSSYRLKELILVRAEATR